MIAALHPMTIAAHTLALRRAVEMGDEDRAADEARYLARWRRVTRDVTLPAALEART